MYAGVTTKCGELCSLTALIKAAPKVSRVEWSQFTVACGFELSLYILNCNVGIQQHSVKLVCNIQGTVFETCQLLTSLLQSLEVS